MKTAQQNNQPQTGQLEIVTTQAGEVSTVPPAHEPLSIESAFRAVVHGSLDGQKLAVLKELLAMDAVRKFNAAFVTLQSEMPTIIGAREIPDRYGNVKFRYANFEDIDDVVRPICLRNGFTYSFRESAYENGRATTTMTLMHSGGHFIEIPCTVRIGGGPPGTSEAQNDGGAHTYGKRNALEMGLSLRIVGSRDDARIEGNLKEKITEEQADELERRVHETNSNVAAFLKFAGASKFSEIPANRYDDCDQMLRRKEKGGL